MTQAKRSTPKKGTFGLQPKQPASVDCGDPTCDYTKRRIEHSHMLIKRERGTN